MSGGQSSARAAVRSDAAGWFNLRLSGDMTIDDEQRFQDWLDLSESHRTAYDRIGRAWVIAGSAADDPELRAADDPAPAEEAPAPQRWRFLAMAASLVLVISLGWTNPGKWPISKYR